MQQAGKKAAPCRVCGQELHASITETTDSYQDPDGERTVRFNRYQMKDRMSPIFLQQNTMQVGHLLTALQKSCDHEWITMRRSITFSLTAGFRALQTDVPASVIIRTGATWTHLNGKERAGITEWMLRSLVWRRRRSFAVIGIPHTGIGSMSIRDRNSEKTQTFLHITGRA